MPTGTGLSRCPIVARTLETRVTEESRQPSTNPKIPCTLATSGHSAPPDTRTVEESGGLEVPSSNLGAPMRKGPAKGPFQRRGLIRISNVL